MCGAAGHNMNMIHTQRTRGYNRILLLWNFPPLDLCVCVHTHKHIQREGGREKERKRVAVFTYILSL